MPTDRNIKFIAFDADDTLWENEIYFRELEHNFCNLLSNHMPESVISRELLNTEIKNLHLYGYGLKSKMLSMIETACKISKEKTAPGLIETIINQGRLILQKPVTLLNGVTETLETLSQKYKLVMATKGDLLDQQRKNKKLWNRKILLSYRNTKRQESRRLQKPAKQTELSTRQLPHGWELYQIGCTPSLRNRRICRAHTLSYYMATREIRR